MESNKELSSVIERVRSLQHNLNIEIQNTSSNVNFCKHCSVSERLIVVRESVKEVENSLLFLRKLQSWQVKEKGEALSGLEGSRLVLMDLVESHRGKYSTRGMLRELWSFFDSFIVEQPNLNRKWSVSRLVRKLFNGLKFVLFCVAIRSMVKVGGAKKLCTDSLALISSEKEIGDDLLMISRNPLDVFLARG